MMRIRKLTHQVTRKIVDKNNMFENSLSSLHKILVSGALSKGWGGPVCRQSLDIQTHVIESSLWLLLALISFQYFHVYTKLKILWKNINVDLNKFKNNYSIRAFEYYLSMIHFIMFFQVLYYKFNISSLINMLQPCHMILLLEGLALYMDNTLSVLISLFILPALIGALLAMLFPDTAGLDQPYELTAYWLQHYLILSVPLHLLLRKNGIALKYASFFTASFCGIWILLLLHFSLYEVVDLALDVNVEFMLCPTDGMLYVASNVPSWVMKPSWRSTMTFIVFAVGPILSYTYITLAKILHRLVASRK